MCCCFWQLLLLCLRVACLCISFTLAVARADSCSGVPNAWMCCILAGAVAKFIQFSLFLCLFLFYFFSVAEIFSAFAAIRWEVQFFT